MSAERQVREDLQGYLYKTRLGWIGIAYTGSGVAGIGRPCATEGEAAAELEATVGGHVRLAPRAEGTPWAELGPKIDAYFGGAKVEFDEQVDLTRLTPFHRQVLELTRRIPSGETRSYGSLARELERPGAARAVGQALHRNPVAIVIPCHRVVSSEGKLQGFGWGLDLKRRLLDLEAGGL